jgi:hypothetical protein
MQDARKTTLQHQEMEEIHLQSRQEDRGRLHSHLPQSVASDHPSIQDDRLLEAVVGLGLSTGRRNATRDWTSLLSNVARLADT